MPRRLYFKGIEHPPEKHLQEKTMTKAELKQMYPALCKEIFEEGRFVGLSGDHGDAAPATAVPAADIMVQAAEKYRDRN
jgi:hypothetical protein